MKISGSGLIRTPMAGVLGRSVTTAWVPGAILDVIFTLIYFAKVKAML